MGWTRRRFVGRVAAGTAGLAVGARLRAADQVQGKLGEFPLAGLVRQFRRATDPVEPAQGASGARRAYLDQAGSIVRFFSAHQDVRGAIIDPYEHAEKQYSTPAFALAGAALLSAGRLVVPLSSVVRAMAFACASLADGKAADGHPDFYTVLLMHADRLLAPLVPESTSTAWRRDLARIVPERIYRRQPTDATTNNWNLVAAAGEWMRTKAGLGDSMPWIEASLDRQIGLFTPWGMYRDPNDPMAYDHFARLWVLDLLDEGYNGRHAAALEELVERGAWVSLFMQSPRGELPCGGRSAHHQWNEAQQAVTFESWASRFATRGDLPAAGACKRAALRSQLGPDRWHRPSGELWIVKNRMDPAARHGYESYSFHSQYNLLTAAMLAMAWERADDRVVQRQYPAETGGFAFAIQPAFHKVFANATGFYVEIDTGADLHYNPTGVLRLHRGVVPPPLLSDGVTAGASYQLPSKPTRSLALGPEWRDRSGAWHALADHGREDLDPAEFVLLSAPAPTVEFRLTYRGRLRGGATAIAEHVVVTPGRVEIEHRVDGDVDTVRQDWPMLASDGVTPSVITVAGQSATMTREGWGFRFQAMSDGAVVSRLGVSEPCRNGFMDACVAEVPGRTVRSKIEAPASPSRRP
jgi:hypothetical protein